MDLDDSFTQKLLMRSKARKEYLQEKKLESPLGKKRAALVEEQQIPAQANSITKESPKRLCVETKEVKRQEENVSPEKEVHLMARGLAAIRRKNSNQDVSNEKKDNPEMNKPATYFFSTNSSEVCSNRKTRLNNLAAQINGWEDNLSSKPIISKANIINERKNVNKPMGKEDTKKLPPREIFSRSISKDVKETLNSSFEPSNLPLSARKALFEQGTVSTQLQKQSIEPQLSVAQRAAMFENASKKKFTPSSSVKPPAKSACDNVVKSSSGLSCKSPVKLTGGSTCESPVKSAVRLNTASPIKLTTGSPNKPVASLICTSPVKSVASVICASPVKASAESTCGSPLKSSARMNKETPSKSFIPKPPVEPSSSPSQRQWVETVSKDTGKKQEISSLVSHWENLSSSSVPTSPSEEEYTASIEKVPFTSNEELNEENELNKSDCVSDGQNESGSCDEQESILEEESDEEDDTFMESATFNPKEFSTAAGLDTETDSMAQTDDDARSSVTDQYSAKSSISEGSSHFSHSLSSSSCGTEDGEEHPLQYTVSFYRKQKQETRNSPVRTIVRREPSHKTESTQACNTQDIQERIQRLQEEVMRHQTVISQTSQALTLCLSTAEFSGSAEQVEGERLLLIATQKRQACLNEIQRLKAHGASGSVTEQGTGTLTITNTELPLKRDFIAAQLEGKNSDAVHYFLCLLRHGHQVIVTQMVSTDDNVSQGSLHFTNLIQLQNLPPDFSIVFEVYTLEHSKNRLTPKGKKTDGKLPVLSSPGPHAVRSPSFRVVGYTRFNLQNCNKKCFTLDKLPFPSPLEGVLKVKLQLHAEHNVTEKGFLTMFEDVSGFGAWHRRWCSLNGHLLSYWKYPDEESKKNAMGAIDLRQCVTREVRVVPRDICARPHTFQLVQVRPRQKEDRDTLISQSGDTLTTTRRLLSADTKEERERWCARLNDALSNVRQWDPQALAPTQ